MSKLTNKNNEVTQVSHNTGIYAEIRPSFSYSQHYKIIKTYIILYRLLIIDYQTYRLISTIKSDNFIRMSLSIRLRNLRKLRNFLCKSMQYYNYTTKNLLKHLRNFEKLEKLGKLDQHF